MHGTNMEILMTNFISVFFFLNLNETLFKLIAGDIRAYATILIETHKTEQKSETGKGHRTFLPYRSFARCINIPVSGRALHANGARVGDS